jgi:hypothetical protein
MGSTWTGAGKGGDITSRTWLKNGESNDGMANYDRTCQEE